MSELSPFQKAERSVVGSIGEGIVLALFRGSGYRAFHAGELQYGNPDIWVKRDDRDQEQHFEVKFKMDKPPWEKDFLNRRRYRDRRASIIWINLMVRPYIRIAPHPWSFRNRLLVTEPIMDSAFVRERFRLDPTVYAHCEFLIDKHCVFPWMEYDVQPPSQ